MPEGSFLSFLYAQPLFHRLPQILRKRGQQDENDNPSNANNKRNKLRNRRVSFAPDEGLQTMHLYAKVIAVFLRKLLPRVGAPSPAVPLTPDCPSINQDDALTPNSELTENIKPLYDPNVTAPAAVFGSKPGFDFMPQQTPVSPALSPMSMDLTGNTMELQGADDTRDSSGPLQLTASFTRNITESVPGLSTLVEEDEEGYQEQPSSAAAGAISRDDTTSASMELTQPAGGHIIQAFMQQQTQQEGEAAAAAAGAAAASATPARGASVPASPLSERRLTRSASKSAAASPLVGAPLPVTIAPSPLIRATPASAAKSPSKQQRSATKSPAAAAAAAGSSRKARTPAKSPATAAASPAAVTPSGSLAPISPLSDSMLGAAPPAAAADLPSIGASPALPVLSPVSLGDSPASIATSTRSPLLGGGGFGSDDGVSPIASAMKDKWGFIPGEDDTMQMRLNEQGRQMMGDVTYKHVYGDSTTTGVQQHLAAGGGGNTAHSAARGLGLGGGMAAAPRQSFGSPLAAPAVDGGDNGTTMRLLADDEEDGGTGQWGQPLHGGHLTTGRGSVGSNVLTGLATFRQANAAYMDSTQQLLNATTQLLVDNETQGALEQFMQRVGRGRPDDGAALRPGSQPPPDRPAAPTRSSGTTPVAAAAAKSSAMAAASPAMAMAAAGSPSPLLLVRVPTPSPIPSPQLELAGADNGAGDTRGLLEEHTLDDFALPPEPNAAAANEYHHNENGPRPLGGTLRMTQTLQQPQPASPATAVIAPQLKTPVAAPLTAHRTPATGAAGLVAAGDDDVTRQAQAQLEQLALAASQFGLTKGGLLVAHSVQKAVAITFHDFLQLVDLQFLDHMRRATSINVMDLATDPMPRTLSESYHLVGLPAVEVPLYKSTIAALQQEMSAKRARLAEAEEALARSNPSVFRAAQGASRGELEAIKSSMALLKKCCRTHTMTSWKQLRIGMEQQLDAALRDRLATLQTEQAFFATCGQQAALLRTTVEAMVDQMHAKMTEEVNAHDAAVAAAAGLKALRRHLGQATSANAERRERLAAVTAQRDSLQASYERVILQKAELARKVAALKAQEAQESPSKGQQAAAALVSRAEELDILAGLQSWRLQRTPAAAPEAGASSGQPQPQQQRWSLVFSDKLRLDISPSAAAAGGFSCAVTVLPAGFQATPLLRQLLPHVQALCASSFAATKASLLHQVRAAAAQLGRMCDTLKQLDTLLLSWTHLSKVAIAGDCLELSFVDVESEAKLAVRIPLTSLVSLPHGALSCTPVVELPGALGLTEAAAAEALSKVGGGYWPLHQVCYLVTKLMVPSGSGAAAQASAALAAKTPLKTYGNPLFA